MKSFSLLDFENRVVYEDEQISVHGFVGGLGRFSKYTGSVFFMVVSGFMTVNGYMVTTGMFGAALANDLEFYSDIGCRAMFVMAKYHKSIFTLGGPVENIGRLQYIDGCTDTCLISPYVKGDPCLNYLHFPKWIKQTRHTHPSHRIGVVYDGSGFCHTENDTIPMLPESMFIIPADTVHSFQTDGNYMRIVAFHPDSDVGPTDEVHQMRKATILA